MRKKLKSFIIMLFSSFFPVNPPTLYPTTPLEAFFIGCIRIYQKIFATQITAECRFYPSCSNYAYQATKKYGAFWGVVMTSERLQRCHYCAAPIYPIKNRKFYDPPERHYYSPTKIHLFPAFQNKFGKSKSILGRPLYKGGKLLHPPHSSLSPKGRE